MALGEEEEEDEETLAAIVVGRMCVPRVSDRYSFIHSFIIVGT